MPRASRAAAGGFCYHVLNRGNARAEVFHKDDDYDAFVQIIAEASLRNPMRVRAYWLMPNHFHLALWPAKDGDLSRWMHWLLTTHVRRYQRHYHSSGHIWQGRFEKREKGSSLNRKMGKGSSLNRAFLTPKQSILVLSPLFYSKRHVA